LERLFKEVYEAKPRTTRRKTTTNHWISKTTYNLFKKKATARAHNQAEQTKQLGKLVQQSLKDDQKIRVERVAKQSTHFLETNNSHEASQYLQGWYKPARVRSSNPNNIDMTKIQQEYLKLYAKAPPVEPPIQTNTVYNINDQTPDEEEITTALKRMRLKKAPGLWGILIDMIRQWQQKAKDKEQQCQKSTEICEKSVQIIQHAFRTGDIPTSFSHGVIVLIPKPKNQEYRGIALLNTIYKIISMIIHLRLTSTIKLHEAVHRFWEHRGTGTATMNIKLLMQKAKRQSNPIYMVFLDIN
jgi:hypothetical protein